MTVEENRNPNTALCALICAAALVGCSAKSNRGTVTGNVTLDGQPLKSGIIRFVPADGGTATADGQIIDGKFSVNVPQGDKLVSITAQRVIGKKKATQMPDSPLVDVTEEIVPARFNLHTTLTYAVRPDSQQKDFDLKTGK